VERARSVILAARFDRPTSIGQQSYRYRILSNRYSTAVYRCHSKGINNDSIRVNLLSQKRFCASETSDAIAELAEWIWSARSNEFRQRTFHICTSEQELSIRWWSRRQFDFARAIRLYEIGTALDSFNCGKFNGRHRFAVRIMQFSVGIYSSAYSLSLRTRYVYPKYPLNIPV